VKRLETIALGCALALGATSCDDNDIRLLRAQHDRVGDASRPSGDGDRTPGVCELRRCPQPTQGAACCTPSAHCGFDPLGLGLNCAPHPGDPLGDGVCDLSQCPLPAIGEACCTPSARCGSDPFASGQFCFANPPTVNFGFDASIAEPEPTCDIEGCAEPEVGLACCLPAGGCGVDMTGFGICFPELTPADGGALPLPSTTPPDDPSVTGECPSYLGFFGPIWGCCSDFGICGTFAADQCLLPVGTVLPVSAPDDDAGVSDPFLRCTRPPQ
jgi:hypothetical protein